MYHGLWSCAPHSLNLRSILQVFLEHRPRDEIEQLVMAKTNGATPLVLSCRNGHREVVEYLLERCNADVEQPGSVTFDGEGRNSIAKLKTSIELSTQFCQ